jgi:hypothetical protein
MDYSYEDLLKPCFWKRPENVYIDRATMVHRAYARAEKHKRERIEKNERQKRKTLEYWENKIIPEIDLLLLRENSRFTIDIVFPANHEKIFGDVSYLKDEMNAMLWKVIQTKYTFPNRRVRFYEVYVSKAKKNELRLFFYVTI